MPGEEEPGAVDFEEVGVTVGVVVDKLVVGAGAVKAVEVGLAEEVAGVGEGEGVHDANGFGVILDEFGVEFVDGAADAERGGGGVGELEVDDGLVGGVGGAAVDGAVGVG